MKKVKLFLTGATILAVVGSAVAFKAVKFHTANLYYLNTSSVCKASTNATNKAGSTGTPTHEADFASGYFSDKPVVGQTTGCQISVATPHAVDGL